jgi:hypothetical protein
MERKEEKIERIVYENALSRMKKLGIKSIMIPHLLEKKDTIKSSLLTYYESTEEFEKCKFVLEFFETLEKEIKILGILDKIKKS